MAHCKPEEIEDLDNVLAKIGSFSGVKTLRPGVFYLKSKAFMHFHLKNERRWADVKDGHDWGQELDISINPSQKEQTKFLSEVRKRYERTVKKTF